MTTSTVNAGARLDRLPISAFHRRIFFLVGAGMFFDGYDLYVAGGVLAATIQSKFSTLPQNLQFISLTFVGMTIGSLVTGFVGDKFGRRFTYQINLLIFGLASLAAAFAQDMTQLIACRFVQGLGLGAEVPVAATYISELARAKGRGRFVLLFELVFPIGLVAVAIMGRWIVPIGWQYLFFIGGIPALFALFMMRNRLQGVPLAAVNCPRACANPEALVRGLDHSCLALASGESRTLFALSRMSAMSSELK